MRPFSFLLFPPPGMCAAPVPFTLLPPIRQQCFSSVPLCMSCLPTTSSLPGHPLLFSTSGCPCMPATRPPDSCSCTTSRPLRVGSATTMTRSGDPPPFLIPDYEQPSPPRSGGGPFNACVQHPAAEGVCCRPAGVQVERTQQCLNHVSQDARRVLPAVSALAAAAQRAQHGTAHTWHSHDGRCAGAYIQGMK